VALLSGLTGIQSGIVPQVQPLRGMAVCIDEYSELPKVQFDAVEICIPTHSYGFPKAIINRYKPSYLQK
jgi:hypothetical protein